MIFSDHARREAFNDGPRDRPDLLQPAYRARRGRLNWRRFRATLLTRRSEAEPAERHIRRRSRSPLLAPSGRTRLGGSSTKRPAAPTSRSFPVCGTFSNAAPNWTKTTPIPSGAGSRPRHCRPVAKLGGINRRTIIGSALTASSKGPRRTGALGPRLWAFRSRRTIEASVSRVRRRNLQA